MHVRFVGEPNDGISVSSQHAKALAAVGVTVSFDEGPDNQRSARPDVLHLVTFEQRSNALLRRLVARIAGIQIVRYWTGRDVVWARHHRPTRSFARTLISLGALQVCRTPKIAEDLAALGIAAEAAPVISPYLSNIVSPKPLPSTFTALCYLPSGRAAFHGESMIRALAQRLPWVRFLILGWMEVEASGLSNVEPLGVVEDAARAIQRATVILEPRIDGALSRLMLEALCHGRHVVASCVFPHCSAAGSVGEFEAALRRLRENAGFNLPGREHVCKEHDHFSAVKALRRSLEAAIEPGRLNLALEGGVRGAAAALRNPHLLGHREFPLPASDLLSPDSPLRALLVDADRARIAVEA